MKESKRVIVNRKTNNRKVGKEEHGKEQDRRTNQETKEM